MANRRSKRTDKVLSQCLALFLTQLVLLTSAPGCVLAQEPPVSLVDERGFAIAGEVGIGPSFSLEPVVEAEKTTTTNQTNKSVSITSLLSPEQSAKLFSGIARLPEQSSSEQKLILPQDSIIKPLPSNLIVEQFPPSAAKAKQSARISATAAVELGTKTLGAEQSQELESQPLEVSRISHTGAADEVGQLTITFSHPLVELAQLNQEEKVNPAAFVSISPEPKGAWQWAGTQTLIFTPDGGRFPKATTYTVAIPVTAQSIEGHRMAKAESYTINFPPAKVTNFYPESSFASQGLTPLIVAKFNQNIDQNAVLAKAHVFVDAKEYPIKMVDKAEYKKRIEAMAEAKRTHSKLPDNGQTWLSKTYLHALPKSTDQDWIAIEPTGELPKSAVVKVIFDKALPSAEGPLESDSKASFQFGTYGPLALITKATKGAPTYESYTDYYPSSSVTFDFNNDIDQEKLDKNLISLSPSVENLKVKAVDGKILVDGAFKPLTNYRVVFSKTITDVFQQQLKQDITASLKIGEPQTSSSTGPGFVSLAPEGPLQYSFNTVAKQKNSHSHSQSASRRLGYLQ